MFILHDTGYPTLQLRNYHIYALHGQFFLSFFPFPSLLNPDINFCLARWPVEGSSFVLCFIKYLFQGESSFFLCLTFPSRKIAYLLTSYTQDVPGISVQPSELPLNKKKLLNPSGSLTSHRKMD